MPENDEIGKPLPAIDTSKWTSTFIAGKVQELQHHLRNIVEACNASLTATLSQEQQPQDLHKIIVYDFSSFTNTVQTLKDSASAAAGEKISWSKIGALRHGEFFYLARNAATHDGNPIISMWVDGYFFVPTDIVRRGERGLVRIPAPRVDVRTFCLEFACDFSNLLAAKLSTAPAAKDQISEPGNVDLALKLFLALPLVPAFAKELLASNQDEILRAIREAPNVDPLATAIAELEKLKDYCFRQLVAIPPMYAEAPTSTGA